MWILGFSEVPGPLEPKGPGLGTMLGGMSFLSFVAEDQAFLGKAEGRVGC